MPLILYAAGGTSSPPVAVPPPPVIIAPPLLVASMGPSDRQPDGGSIAPLLPPTYTTDTTNLLAYVAPFDAAIEDRRARLTAVYQAHVLAYAGGDDLAAIGARYGLYPLSNEDDNTFRQRIPATVAGHVNPTSRLGMQATLTVVTNRAVAITNQATPGRFLVVFEGLPPQGLGIVPIIAALAAGGYQFDAVARAGSGTGAGRVGQFHIGQQRVGGGGGYVTLTPRAPATQQTGHARVGQFRVGQQRLGA